jgi:hypothetical protein
MRVRALLLGLALVATGGSALCAQASGGSSEASVRATVDTYLYGLKHNDVASFRKAFWPEAKLFFLKKDRSLGELTQADWYKGFAASAGKEEEGDLRIVSVDVTGPGASVKVEEHYPGSKYTDYLSLLKIQGEWKIVNKIYVVEKR